MAWEELEDTPHHTFYRSENGENLYIVDTHSNHLDSLVNGDQYHLTYRDGDQPSMVTVLDTEDDLETMLEEAEAVVGVGSDRSLDRYHQVLEEQGYKTPILGTD